MVTTESPEGLKPSREITFALKNEDCKNCCGATNRSCNPEFLMSTSKQGQTPFP
uniref:Fcr2 n=1 Tax=Arundo donax TaxID=35708 RepID=A0A0A9GHC3_ARUDO